jgi:hypothetical protein
MIYYRLTVLLKEQFHYLFREYRCGNPIQSDVDSTNQTLPDHSFLGFRFINVMVFGLLVVGSWQPV